MRRKLSIGGAAWSLLLCGAVAAQAINVELDYTYDSSGFFPAGSAARQTLEQVADFYSEILTDTFSPIFTPASFTSSLPAQHNPGTAFWHWTLTIDNPSGAGEITLTDQSIASDEYRIYVGAKSLSGNTLGEGGPGGVSYSFDNDGGNFTQAEVDQLTATDDAFNVAVFDRGEIGGFARWGGALTFDRDAATQWHFDAATLPTTGKNDFLSVAVHEIGHALGLGASEIWDNLTTVTGGSYYFLGAQATAAYGASVPLVNGGHHWKEGTMSTVFGSATPQEAAMDPTITVGTRKRFTKLDAAALADLGWTVATPELAGDFNNDGTVDAADYTIWRDGLGSTYTQAHYTEWKSHFGQSGGSGNGSAGSVGSTAVPEAGAFISLLTGVVVTLWSRFHLFGHRVA
jgi:hypothetical protein